jgi:hypothetical protein
MKDEDKKEIFYTMLSIIWFSIVLAVLILMLLFYVSDYFWPGD